MNDTQAARLAWRPMTAKDLPAVDALSTRIHPDFPERPEVLAEKCALFPQGCHVLAGSGPRIFGYCFSHPWTFGPPPALDRLLGALPGKPDTYFIHDLTVEAELRGRKHAATLVAELLRLAAHLAVERMMLVAVSGSAPFWIRMGFERTADDALQAAARGKYGHGAIQMERNVAPPA
ncbi:GNAT family N-acetyltransferase [Pseudorhodoplanes sp.]|uniref:GNAT family N-acetyltransferase n=1 Tax=Pseudorhodoplanes sp. TaxID=1934341 RepID=UPI00391DB24D